ncbi:prepilin-type N-terminal cleavage/methylation domain-containing protein [Prosthecobacter sp. SYSU 5D2]|uniref:type II secretion system protein n=1 Tax=Prosthecobacter sp. SYSU 5D2 TaxID=3134134 RepID=UPI0031FE7CAB
MSQSGNIAGQSLAAPSLFVNGAGQAVMPFYRLSRVSKGGQEMPRRHSYDARGFSVTELVITIAILGVLAGVVIVSMTGTFGASQETLAKARVEMLNSALHRWAMAYPEMYFPASAGSINDELYVLRALQFRDPDENKAAIGSPFMPPEYNPRDSSSTEDYRIRWNGRIFELLRPGQQGTGLLMVFDASDITDPVTFAEDYKPGSF